MEKVEFPIDIVIPWVDQNDPAWFAKFNQYNSENLDEDTETRYRDYGTLQYVFRSIQKYAPWVNRIFFLTDNQKPDWLNLESEKLVCVDHTEFIDQSFLPTFDSNVIDLSVANISGLSEHFVYFNDDTFINRPVTPEDFFDSKGRPRDTLAFNSILPMSIFDHIHVNNLMVINHSFNKKEIIKKDFFKLFNLRNGVWNIFTALMLPWPRFTRFYDPHIPISFLKSTYSKVLADNPEMLKATGITKFRDERDFSNWTIRYFQMLSGEFSPRRYNFGVRYTLDSWQSAIKDIQNSKHHLVNINDSNQMDVEQFNHATKLLESVFQEKFPEKSEFEIA